MISPATDIFENVRTVTTTSVTRFKQLWKPGGILIRVIGIPSGGIVETTEDKHGLGWWIKMRIAGKDGRHISLFGVYQAPSASRPGPRTVQFQQRILLISEAIENTTTDPWLPFIDKFIEDVLSAQSNGDKIIIVTDINAVINQDTHGLNWVIAECGLIDMMQHIPSATSEPPRTYDQSGNHIN